MQLSDAGLDMIKRLEGFRANAYQDSAGVWTIGYGHTGKYVHEGVCIDAAEAQTLLLKDLMIAQACVNEITQRELVTQGEYDALVSLVFNVGCEALRYSTLADMIRAGRMDEAVIEMFRWVHVGGQPNQGLINRRMAEARRFIGR